MKFQNINKFILIVLGLFMFSSYIWLRFLRERFPRDIPFTLSILGFLILIDICCIYAYILYSLLKKHHIPNPFIIYIVDTIYKPLIAFDSFLKSFYNIQIKYLKLVVLFANKLVYIFRNTSIFYFTFAILPRLVLVSALFIDVFYFHKLFYIYKVLLLGILLFLNRYIIYSFKYAKQLLILQNELYISNITMKYIHYIYMELYADILDEDDKDYDDIPPTMGVPLKKFIEIQTNAIVYQNKPYDYMITYTDLIWEETLIKHNLKSDKQITEVFIDEIIREGNTRMNDIMQISILLEYFYGTRDNNDKYKTLKKSIFTNYLLC